MTTIIVFAKTDVKKNGQLKTKNHSMEFDEDGFTRYVRENNLKLSSGYIDSQGYISNGKIFRCYYNNLIIGVTGIIKKIQN